MNIRKVSNAWRRKQAKKAVKRAKIPMFRNRVTKVMDNVRGGTKYTLGNRSAIRLMKKNSKKKHN
jgi:hypothetical protein